MLTRVERAVLFSRPGPYPVISSEFTLGRDPFEIFEAVAAGGAKLVQLREKNRGKKYLYELARRCRPVADRHEILLIINDHVDVALAAEADGVHLGQDDLPLEAARALAPELWLGNSTHNLEEAERAKLEEADCINIGPIFPTATKNVQCGALGIAMIGEIAPRVGLPFSVMGGIKTRHFPELIAAGARHIAMVTEITQADDVEAKTRELCAFFADVKN